MLQKRSLPAALTLTQIVLMCMLWLAADETASRDALDTLPGGVDLWQRWHDLPHSIIQASPWLAPALLVLALVLPIEQWFWRALLKRDVAAHARLAFLQRTTGNLILVTSLAYLLCGLVALGPAHRAEAAIDNVVRFGDLAPPTGG